MKGFEWGKVRENVVIKAQIQNWKGNTGLNYKNNNLKIRKKFFAEESHNRSTHLLLSSNYWIIPR